MTSFENENSKNNIPFKKMDLNREIDLTNLSKKLGKMETSLNYLDEKISEENTKRTKLDKQTQKISETLNSEINSIKFGIDSFSKAFSDNLERMKNTLIEDIEFKTDNLTKIIMEISKRIDDFENKKIDSESLSLMSNSGASNLKILDDRIKILEKLFSSSNMKPNRDIEMNTGLAKINFCQKKLDDTIEKYEKKINDMNEEVKYLKNEVEMLKHFRNNSENNFQHFQRDFITTTSNNSKFNYQTTMILNETNKKMDNYQNIMKQQTDDLKNLKSNLLKQFNELKSEVNSNLNLVNSSFDDNSKIINENHEKFKENLMCENDKFIDFVQCKMEEYFNKNNKNLSEYYQNILNVKELIDELSKKVIKMQNKFFNNLNEVEDCLNKKFDSLSRIVNNSKF